ncbi:MAG: DUF4142 domain-containing protein [Polyangiales bacterium]
MSVAVAVFALGVGAYDARAETKTQTKGNTADKTACTMDDATKVRSVIQFLHAANQAEIKLGKLAQTKSQNADVKAYGDRMVKDHTDADKKLDELASKQSIDLNAQMADPVYLGTIATQETLARDLGGKTGNAFDVAYIAGQPGDHLFVLKVIEEGQKVSKDDAKKALDEAHAMVTGHKQQADKAIGMLQLAPSKAPKAIGGGPNDNKQPSTSPSSSVKSPDKTKTPDKTKSPDDMQSPDYDKRGPDKMQSPDNTQTPDKTQDPDNSPMK